jgi:hypothetical protein
VFLARLKEISGSSFWLIKCVNTHTLILALNNLLSVYRVGTRGSFRGGNVAGERI